MDQKHEPAIDWRFLAASYLFLALVVWITNLDDRSRWRLSLHKLSEARVFWFEVFTVPIWISVTRWFWEGTTDSKPETPDDAQTQLSWQSAMGALLAIALATMSNVSSRLVGFPERLTFFLKSSPLTCLANVLSTFGALMPAKGWTFEDRVMHLAIQKFGDRGFEHLSHQSVRIYIFILGSVPQAIKLYASQGIVFTQLMTTFYLLDFINNELILSYAQRNTYYLMSTLHPEVRNSHSIGVAYVFNCLWAITLLLGIMYADIDSHWPKWGLVSICFTPLAGWALYGLCVHAFGSSKRIQNEFRLLFLPAAAVVCCIPSVLLLHGTKMVLLVALFAYIALFAVSINLLLMWPFVDGEDKVDFPQFAFLALTFFNLTAYYTTIYDAAQTSRPAWTNWLG